MSLDPLLRPRSVAVVGASADPSRIGGMVLANLRNSGFAGDIFAVSRSGAIDGVHCVATVDALPHGIDLAFLAVPAEATPDAVRACAAAGMRAVIVGSAGYAESGPEGAARQAEIAAIAQARGMRVVGPNCNGLYNARLPVSVGFNVGHALRITPGDVAILSHSGALFDVFARRLMDFGAGLSLFVSAGNEADLNVLDYLEYCIADEATRVIALVLDGIADGRRLRTLARAAADAGKALVALKVGLSDRGEAAAVAHSSRMTSGGRAYQALLEACGIPLARTVEGLIAGAALVSRHGRGAGGAAVFSTSGAGGALMADLAEARDIAMPDFASSTQAVLDRHTRFSRAVNPIDVGVFGSFAAIDEIAGAVAADPEVGVVIGFLPTLAPVSRQQLASAYAAAQRASGKPHLILSPGGLDDAGRAAFETEGLMCFTETGCCLEAVAAFLAPAASLAEAKAAPIDPLTPGPLGEADSLALLDRFGVPVVKAIVCADAEAAVRAAGEIGYPVVAKGVVEGVAHKSDHGLVHLNLADDAALRGACAAIDGPVLVQPMLRGELEAIVGVTVSSDVGALLLAGHGGIHAEALGDYAVWSIPASRDEIERKLKASSLGRIVTGERWRFPETWPALVEALLAVQRLALAGEGTIAAIDVNPLLLGGEGAVAVDALVVGAELRSELAAA
ncbi:MAG: acetate--CoA ligase family protein [Sphingomonadaceae bacterium]|nr:acetate--CoA ligase family protein [Sphingomonadaceae bacterium]